MNNLTPEEIKNLKAVARREKMRWTSLKVILLLFIGFAVLWMIAILVAVALFISSPK